MRRVAVIAVCGLALSACSSMPSFELPKASPPATTMQLESVPPGAEARVSAGGASCRTPCALAVASDDFTVTFTLPGYQPQTVPVRVLNSNERVDPNTQTVAAPQLSPNPVYVELVPAPPPVAVKKKKAVAAKPKKIAPGAVKRAPAAATPPPAPAPAPAAAWPPPPQR
jgi:hypothetical protein